MENPELLETEVHLPRCPEMGASSKGNESSSNQQFSGDILVFNRVYTVV